MHRFSFISGKENSLSLKVEYERVENEIQARFIPHEKHTSYENTVHGGLLAALLDDAMAVSINSSGIVAYTGKLELRYRKPPRPGEELFIRAWIEQQKSPFLPGESLRTFKKNC